VWVSTLIGTAIIVLIVVDIFETLFDPEDQGRLTNAVSWSVWRICQQLPLPVLGYAGPLAYIAVLGSWALLLVTGWALIYWPHLPDAFEFDAGLDPQENADFVSAFYLSLVTLATLGYGDITPVAGWLRVLGPVQSLLGFLLLSAAITWILAIYQDIELRRSLAHEKTLLQDAISETDINVSDLQPDSIERLIDEVTSRLVLVTGSLNQFPITYFFRISDDRQSLAAMSLFLADLSDELRHERLPREVRLHANMLSGALDHLAEALAERFVRVSDGASTRDILLAYAKDHHRAVVDQQRQSDLS
jgi:hypothetical protein